MAESRLKVILETSGTGKIKNARTSVDLLKKAVQGLEAAFKKTIPLQDKVARGFSNLGAKALGAARGIKGAAKSLSSLQGVLGGLAVGALFKGAIDEAVAYEAALSRIGRLEGQFKQLAGLQETAAQSAEKLFVSQTSAAKAYADLGARLGPAISNVKELQAVYEGLEIVLLKNAKSTGEAASLQLQLNQALGKGVLNGDEFRSIAENAPEVLRQLAIDAGISEQAIKDLATQGGITRDKLIKAFANLRNSGIEDFDALLETNLGKIRKYDKAISDLQLTIGQELLPVFTPLIESLTYIARLFSALPAPIKRFLVALTGVLAVVSVLAPLIAGLTLAVVVLGAKFVLAAALITALGLALLELPSILQVVADKFAFVGKFFQDVWKGVTDFIRDTWIALNSLISRAWRKTTEFLMTALRFFGFGSGEVFEDVGNGWKIMVDFMAETWSGLFKGIGEQLKKFGAAFGSAITNIPGPIGDLARFLSLLGSIELPSFDVNSGLKNLDIDFPDSGSLPEGDESGGKSGRAAKAKAKAQKDQLRAARDLLRASLDEKALLEETTKLGKIKIQGAIDLSKIAIKYGRLAEKAKTDEEVQTLVIAQSTEALNAKTKQAQALGKEYDNIANKFKSVFQEGKEIDDAIKGPFEDLAKQVIPAVGTAIQDSIVTALEAAIKGTDDLGKSLQKIASSLLKQVGGMFLNAGFKGIQGQMFPNLFGNAEGSYISTPTPALIGEGGEPEYVIPQSKMDGAMSRWGSGQSGSQVLADGGEMVGGGSALADQPPQINISGGVMQVGGEDFVRLDQIPSIIAQSAKAGEAKALRSLQMSPSARRMAGV